MAPKGSLPFAHLKDCASEAFRLNPNPSPCRLTVLIRTTARTVASYCAPGLVITSTLWISLLWRRSSSVLSETLLPLIYTSGAPLPITSKPFCPLISPGVLESTSLALPAFSSTEPRTFVCNPSPVSLVFGITALATAPSSICASSERVITAPSTGARYTVL